MVRRTWVLTTAYAVTAAAVLSWSATQVTVAELYPLAQFALLSLVLANWHVELSRGVVLPLSISITAAGQIILPTHLAVLLDALTAAIVAVRRRHPPVGVFFNLSNRIIPTFLAGALFTWSGYRGQSQDSLAGIAVALAVLLLRYMLNVIPASLYLAWRDNRDASEVLKEVVRSDRLGGMSSRLMALLIMLSYPRAGVVALILAGICSLAMRQSAQLYAEREWLYRLARYDALTEVGNRHAWSELLESLQACPMPPYFVATFDLDGLKTVNDAFGHEMGDQVLQSFAQRLSRVVGRDRVFRFGGDEFVILLPRKSSRDVSKLEQLLKEALRDFETEWTSKQIWVSASVGVSVASNVCDIPSALRSADSAMYQQKRLRTRI